MKIPIISRYVAAAKNRLAFFLKGKRGKNGIKIASGGSEIDGHFVNF